MVKLINRDNYKLYPLAISLILAVTLFFFLAVDMEAADMAAEKYTAQNLRNMSDGILVESVNLYQAEPAELDNILGELKVRFPDKYDRLRAIAEMYLGADYYLEPFIDEKNDPLPYSRTNCTMFIIYTAAFLNSSSYQEALDHVRYVHYREGIVSFKTRYHFTSDRITDRQNKYFTDITEASVKDRTQLAELNLTLNQKKDGSLLFAGKLDGWKKTITVKYIKREGFFPGILKPLPEAVGVAFVKKTNWRLGVIVGHEGLLIDGDLYHSGSPSTGLYKIDNYLEEKFISSSWEGMILFELNEVSAEKGGDKL